MFKNKKPMEFVFWATIISLCFAFIGGILIAFAKLKQDSSSSEKSDKILGTTSQNSKSLSQIENTTDTSLTEILELKDKIDSLNYQLTPFKQLAKDKYPNLNENEALIKLKQDINLLQGKTDFLQNRTNELEEKLKPRKLTDVQKKSILSLLKDEHFPIFISSKMMDTECYQFAKQISDVLKHAGWGVFLSDAKTSIVDFQGIGIFSFPDNSFMKAENKLINTFTSVGIVAEKISIPRNKMGEFPNSPCIVLIVGGK